jgi:hypothetical protein
MDLLPIKINVVPQERERLAKVLGVRRNDH